MAVRSTPGGFVAGAVRRRATCLGGVASAGPNASLSYCCPSYHLITVPLRRFSPSLSTTTITTTTGYTSLMKDDTPIGPLLQTVFEVMLPLPRSCGPRVLNVISASVDPRSLYPMSGRICPREERHTGSCNPEGTPLVCSASRRDRA